MLRRIEKTIVVALPAMLLLVGGCADQWKYAVMRGRPVVYTDSSIKQVAVLGFGDDIVTGMVVERLRASKWGIVRLQSVREAFRGLKITPRYPLDKETAQKVGQYLDVDGVIYGKCVRNECSLFFLKVKKGLILVEENVKFESSHRSWMGYNAGYLCHYLIPWRMKQHRFDKSKGSIWTGDHADTGTSADLPPTDLRTDPPIQPPASTRIDPDVSKKTDSGKARVRTLKAEIGRMESQLKSLRPEIDRMNSELKSLEPEIGRMNSELKSLSTSLGISKREIEGYKKQVRPDKDLYSQAVDRHKRLAEQHNSLLANLNLKCDEFNSLLANVNLKSDEFNSLLSKLNLKCDEHQREVDSLNDPDE